MSDDQEFTKVLFRIPTDLYRLVGHAAVEENKTKTAIMIEAIRSRFGDDTEEPKRPIQRKRIANHGNEENRSEENPGEKGTSKAKAARKPSKRRKPRA